MTGSGRKGDRQRDEGGLPACPPSLSSWWVTGVRGQLRPEAAVLRGWGALLHPTDAPPFCWAHCKCTDAPFYTWKTLQGMYVLE